MMLIDPHQGNALMGLRIIEAQETPRYVLPEEVIPGVPWPAGFREDINRWSRSFLGTTCLVPRGQCVISQQHGFAVMRREDIVRVSAL